MGQSPVNPDHSTGVLSNYVMAQSCCEIFFPFKKSGGGEHFFLVSEKSGSEFVQLGDLIRDEENVALASRVGRLLPDDVGLFGAVVSGGDFVGGLGVAECRRRRVLLCRQLLLRLLQLGLQFGPFLSALSLEGLVSLVSVVGQIFGSLDSLQISQSNFDGASQAGLLSGQISMNRLDRCSGSNALCQHPLDF